MLQNTMHYGALTEHAFIRMDDVACLIHMHQTLCHINIQRVFKKVIFRP
jgi:hypothetical protein